MFRQRRRSERPWTEGEILKNRRRTQNSPCFSLRLRWNAEGLRSIAKFSPSTGKPIEPGGRGRSIEGDGEEREEVEVEEGDDDDRKGATGQPPAPPPFSRELSPPPSSMPFGAEAEAEGEGVSSSEERGATASGRRRPP